LASGARRSRRTADLDHVYDAVQKTVAETDMAMEVLAFQAKLVDAVAPFVEAGGTAAAFVTDPATTSATTAPPAPS
jgi:hypothetical protein